MLVARDLVVKTQKCRPETPVMCTHLCEFPEGSKIYHDEWSLKLHYIVAFGSCNLAPSTGGISLVFLRSVALEVEAVHLLCHLEGTMKPSIHSRIK